MEEDDQDEMGWKLVHGDVFRKPVHSDILCCLYGIGKSIYTTCLICLLLWIFIPFDYYILLIALVTFTQAYSVFRSCEFYAKLNENRSVHFWIFLLTTGIFMGPVFFFLSIYNFTSIQRISFSEIIFPWICVGIVLSIVAVVIPRRSIYNNYPCRINSIPRSIPPFSKLKEFSFNAILCIVTICVGFLGIQNIFIESSLYSIIIFCFVIGVTALSMTTASVFCTYISLWHENYLWWWRPIGLSMFVSCCILAIYTWFNWGDITVESLGILLPFIFFFSQ